MPEPITTLAAIVGGIAAFTYIGGPIAIKFGNRSSAHPAFQLFDINRLPSPAAEYVSQQTGLLMAEGFTLQACLALPNQTANVAAYMVLLQNRGAGDQAGVFVMLTTPDGVTKIGTKYVEFSSKFTGGRSFDTNNAPTIGAFEPEPERTVTQVPSVTDLTRLYRLHRWVMDSARAAEGGGREWGASKVYAEGPDGHAIGLAQGMVDQYEKQVVRGVLERTPARDAYLPTWGGAFRMTWGLLPPMAQMRKATMKKAEAETLARFTRETSAESWADRKRTAGY